MSLLNFGNGTLSGSGGIPIIGGTSSSGIQGTHCQDLHGRIIAQGVHYVPGPDACLHCVCDSGGPQLCRAMLCGHPPENRNCKAIRVGTSCCDFICPDEDWLSNGSGGYGGRGGTGSVDMGVVVPKIIITALLSMLSLSLLFFLVNRLRQRDLRAGRLTDAEVQSSRRMYDCDDDPRSMDYSFSDFSRNSSFRNGYPPQYTTWWKPPYFPPRGEAPPPYEEAIASTSNIIPLLPLPTLVPPESLTTIAPPPEGVNTRGPREASGGEEGTAKVLSLNLSGPPSQEASSRTTPPEPRISNRRVESRQHPNNGAQPQPPAYSSLVPPNRSGSVFRRSLTLPRRPNFLLTDPGDLEGTSRCQPQRYSLQLGVTDWNTSSSSSLSLTPTTPILGREDSSSSSPTSSASSLDLEERS